MAKQDFLTLRDFDAPTLRALLDRAIALKASPRGDEPLKNRTLAMIFEKKSTRTRVSFEVGMNQLGGHALFLSPRDSQLGRGEPVEDTARVLSRMADAIMVRNDSHELLERLAGASRVPVINGLTDLYHPCQILADMQTYLEHRGPVKGRTVAWVGDGNNVCHSYINGANLFGYRLMIATPQGYEPDAAVIQQAGGEIALTQNASEAVQGADLVVTDVWASMGQENEQRERAEVFKPFQVNTALMAQAASDAVFMHCLPAHRGEEVTAEVIDGPQSLVWDEAENRLHAQKALLEGLLGEGDFQAGAANTSE
jgi:ornithine carbamoyltransferase